LFRIVPNTILLGIRVPPAFERALAAFGDLLGPLDAPFASSLENLTDAQTRNVRAILSMGSVAIPAAALSRFPNLGLIACLGSGYEGAPVAEARARGIEVTHSPEVNASSVADMAMALLLSAVRNLDVARAHLQAGKFEGNAGVRLPSVKGLTGRKLGIYGMGAIGHRIARRAEVFEMEIAYHNRKPRSDVTYPWHATLAGLAAWADVLMVAVRADASNRHTVNREILNALGSDGFVVNISRGPVVDEAALVEALQAGAIRGAGLDVFEHEPKVTPALFDLPHVALSPHIGGNTDEAQEAMRQRVLDNIGAFFAGRPVPNPVPR